MAARRHKKGAPEVSKHPPPREAVQTTDVYVNNNSHFLAQLDRAQKVLDGGNDFVTIHGLGAAIPLAINLAMEIQHRAHDAFEISTATSTVELVDDVVSAKGDVVTSTRNNSAIHITVRQRKA